MPDGTTTSVGEDGKLSVNTAQQDALGVVKGSDDITVGEDGTLTVNTTFKQATELANIIAGEAIKSVLGKVSKAIATTMNLDENALLKNMISGIDVNDGNKVPSSAYIHSLVERIGMGTALEGGFDNLTAGLNSVNNNLSKFGNLRFLTANTFADAWNKAEAGYTYFIDITSNTDPPTTTANRWFGQMWKNDTGKYGWQVAWSFNGTIYKRERNNSDAWTDWNTYALKSDLDSSKLKSMTFTAMSDEYAQIAIGNPGILICAVSNNYLLARQDNGVCRVIGDIRNNELSFKRNVKVSGIAFYV